MKAIREIVAEYAPLSEFESGYIEALLDYSDFRDGVQYIGSSARPTNIVIEEFLKMYLEVKRKKWNERGR